MPQPPIDSRMIADRDGPKARFLAIGGFGRGPWRKERGEPSLSDIHRSVPVAAAGGSTGRRLIPFLGPGYLVATGYMDPGNWATALAGGSAFGVLMRLAGSRAGSI